MNNIKETVLLGTMHFFHLKLFELCFCNFYTYITIYQALQALDLFRNEKKSVCEGTQTHILATPRKCATFSFKRNLSQNLLLNTLVHVYR